MIRTITLDEVEKLEKRIIELEKELNRVCKITRKIIVCPDCCYQFTSLDCPDCGHQLTWEELIELLRSE